MFFQKPDLTIRRQTGDYFLRARAEYNQCIRSYNVTSSIERRMSDAWTDAFFGRGGGV